MSKIRKVILSILAIVLIWINSNAQDNSHSLLKQVAKENQDAVDAIAMYPTETRKIIFEASEYPEIIAKLNAMHKDSQSSFEKLISSLDKDEQEKIWDMTRYDNLISDLTLKENLSDDEINNILINYPEEIRKTAMEEHKKNYNILVQMVNMNIGFNTDFDSLMSGYPKGIDTIFRAMIKMPEVLSLLFDHMQYTVVVGDYYKKNPQRVIHKTDSLNKVLTQMSSQETDDWKQSIMGDSIIRQEYTMASKDYTEENGYQADDYNTPLTPDVINYDAIPYNWWFGYPSWYPYSYWTPYPFWYDCGFYYGSGGTVVFLGLPSSYFMDWYFYYPEHFSKYSELTNQYYNYYQRHTKSGNHNSIIHSVGAWKNINKEIITDEWNKDNSLRIQRFKEYGKMESNRKKYNLKNQDKPLNNFDFLQKEQNKYPLMFAAIDKNHLKQEPSGSKSIRENFDAPVKKPIVSIPDNYKASSTKQSNNQFEQQIQQNHANYQNNNINKSENKSQGNNQQTKHEYVTPVQNSNQVRNAEQYHQNSWNQIQTQPQPVVQPSSQNNQGQSNNRKK